MGKRSSGGYYAVARGRNVGVFRSWDEAERSVRGFSDAKFKKFPTLEEAQAFVGPVVATPPALIRPGSEQTPPRALLSLGVRSGVGAGVSTASNVWSEAQLIDQLRKRRRGIRDDAEENAVRGGLPPTMQTVATKRQRRMPQPQPKPKPALSTPPRSSPSPQLTANATAMTTVRSPSAFATQSWYAVAQGRRTGVFRTWAEVEPLIRGLFSAKFKKFPTLEAAEAFIRAHQDQKHVPSVDVHNPQTLVAFCDGSALQNGWKNCDAGYACVFPHNPKWNVAVKLREERATNNRAEYCAALEAMKRANIEDPSQQQPLFIFSDSMLLIRSMTEWLDGWQQRGWVKADGTPVKNRDLLENLTRTKGNRRVVWQHVKAHTGRRDWHSKWNDVADRNARNAAAGK